ncbi:S1C family serine protease [Ruminococcus sp.]|uniref:S1C family serine protease n=1 Tax=Ruminococcus sp. TaxID=41978 RepID=UPI002E8241D4|nr:trypsin-like peptidase domain-containing protein [Ruminococcus sp.]MEE3439814.1 trypsin-like peptidase domain-containing protein [Ruminococcus sp.]
MENNNDFELNNPTPAPIPEPLPELQKKTKDGGFNGVANRFCTDKKPSPVKEMPIFTVGEERPNRPDDTFSFTPKKEKNIVAEKSTEEKPNNNGFLSDPKPIETTDNSENIEKSVLGKFNVPTVQKKSSKKGVTILITVIVTVLIMTGGFFAYSVLTGSKGLSVKVEGNTSGNMYEQQATNPAGGNYTSDYTFDQYYNDLVKNAVNSTTTTNTTAKDYTDKNFDGIIIDTKSSGEKSAQSAYEKVSDSTVAILTFEDKISSEENAKGQGTGIIVSSDGYIVTNSHVIGDSKTAYKYQVINNDGKKYTANVVGYDTRTDLAVLKIKGKNLKPVHFVKKSHLQVGEDIIAVGNPGGLDFQNSLTKGIVSAKDRTLDDSTVSYIQTDAAVNPGNSGGPLCNLYGEVIGITTAKINSATYEGMGFAIPSDTVETVVNNIIKYGYVENRVRLGIVGVAVDETASTALGIPEGILITEIADDGSFANSSAKPKNIITKVDGTRVKTFNQVYSVLAKHKVGDKINVEICKVDSSNPSNSKTATINVTLVADKGETQK